MAPSSTRRELMSGLAVAALLPVAAWAQPFPNRPIKLIVPFAAGGAADLFGRSLASGFPRSPASRSWSRPAPAWAGSPA
jgi:hypothetical protein